jgi:nitrate/TMAO reductase-like tetraheme cytochrome c subunit
LIFTKGITMTITTTLNTPCCLALVAALGLGVIGAARADSGRAMPANMPKSYIQECASCHTAYPPALLPKRSWQRIMSSLDQHFGVNASLDEATARQLASWLQVNGGTYKRVSEEPSQDRVTRSAWFLRKHREVEPAVWRHASVKSAANCAACHSGADQGDFDDHNLQAPAGLQARMRRTWNH